MVKRWISFSNTPMLQYSTIARLKDFSKSWIYLFIGYSSFNFNGRFEQEIFNGAEREIFSYE
jgi:hypothetical protein